MGYLLNVSEILGFAVFIEQNGYEFYVEAMKKFVEPKIMEMFQFLADEEFRHEKIFAGLFEEGGKFTPPESYDGEYHAYMKEFCKSHSLANRDAIKPKVERISSIDEALEMALGFEKDSIVFFTGLKDLVAVGLTGPIDRIIREEMGHIRKIHEFRTQQIGR